MINNDLKVAIRNLVKYKVFSFINVLGLATGVAVCLLVMLYVSDELSWDRHFPDYENIYRVGLHGRLGDQELIDPITPPPMARTIISEIPGVVSATRMQNPGFPVLRYEDKVFSEEGFAWVDSNFFNLIDELSVFENVELPLLYQNVPAAERKQRVDELLGKVGVAHRRNHFPQHLSGGQQQRAAVARALVTKPAVILADEPTGSLDTKHGEEVMSLLSALNDEGTTIVMVTHSPEYAKHADRIVNLLDGEIQNIQDNGSYKG